VVWGLTKQHLARDVGEWMIGVWVMSQIKLTQARSGYWQTNRRIADAVASFRSRTGKFVKSALSFGMQF
jgi:hypothetical protein